LNDADNGVEQVAQNRRESELKNAWAHLSRTLRNTTTGVVRSRTVIVRSGSRVVLAQSKYLNESSEIEKRRDLAYHGQHSIMPDSESIREPLGQIWLRIGV